MTEPDSNHVVDQGDSSTALGLSHSYREGAGAIRRLSISPDNELGKGSLAKWDREERERIEAGAAEKREIEIARLMRATDGDGRPLFTHKQAAEIVDKEAGKHGKERKKEESTIAHEKAIEDLMDAHKKPSKHSTSSKGRRRKAPPRITAEQREQKYAEMVGQYEDAHPDPELRAAAIAIEQNARRMNRHGNLKGKEPRIRVQGRMEPSTVVDLHDLTGLGVVEVAEEMHKLLQMARSGEDAQTILGALCDILVDGESQGAA